MLQSDLVKALRARIVRLRDGDGPSDDEAMWARRKTRVYFDNQDLDLYLAFALGRAAARGASLGEAILAASRVSPKDPSSWARAWTDAAHRARDHADVITGSDPVGARDAYLRATTYFRTSMFGQDLSEARGSYEATVQTFRAFAALESCRIEAIEVAWEEWVSPGYFVSPHDEGTPRALVPLSCCS